ncbi:MAG: Rieske 2Fe-2S domain-containing protein [Lacibacter sp.]
MSTEKKYNWHKIADHINELPWQENQLCEIELKGKHICLAQYNSKVSACAAKCPHAGGYLSDGYIDAVGNIVCPLHRYKFSLQTGRNSSGEGYFLTTYPVEEREDGLYLGIEDKKLFGLF